MIIKYLVEKSFKDKYTKKDVIKDSILEVTIERMKELNKKNVGRVIDIIESSDIVNVSEMTNLNNNTSNENQYTEEELLEMTVNELKDLADQLNIELTKAKKDEIVKEILEKNI